MISQTVRGTRDLLSDEWYKFKYIQNTANNISSLYGFIPVETPIFEYTNVFTKTLGNTSDIITKEMYSFEDKGGKSITLRPEFTAAIVRLLIDKKNYRCLQDYFQRVPSFVMSGHKKEGSGSFIK